jgi:hypothetical protein
VPRSLTRVGEVQIVSHLSQFTSTRAGNLAALTGGATPRCQLLVT